MGTEMQDIGTLSDILKEESAFKLTLIFKNSPNR